MLKKKSFSPKKKTSTKKKATKVASKRTISVPPSGWIKIGGPKGRKSYGQQGRWVNAKTGKVA